MKAAIDQFETNIERVRNIGSIYRVFSSQTTSLLDLSDILRAELVLAVSALDQLVHELVRLGMLEAYRGTRSQSKTFLRFKVTMESALEGISSPSKSEWLEEQIRNRHGYQSFQHPDNIAEGIRLISDLKLWNEVEKKIGMNSEYVKKELVLVVNRRNQIAHEADMDPSYPKKRWPINDALVNDAIKFIEQLGKAIYDIVS